LFCANHSASAPGRTVTPAAASGEFPQISQRSVVTDLDISGHQRRAVLGGFGQHP
jgi:hypothetical protein